MPKKSERIEPSELDIPESGMDPMETIRMEGSFYRGIAERNKRKKWWMRIMGIGVGMLFFGSAFLAFASAYLNGTWGIVPGILGLVFSAVGLKMLWANV